MMRMIVSMLQAASKYPRPGCEIQCLLFWPTIPTLRMPPSNNDRMHGYFWDNRSPLVSSLRAIGASPDASVVSFPGGPPLHTWT